jgi:hypothetical protein
LALKATQQYETGCISEFETGSGREKVNTCLHSYPLIVGPAEKIINMGTTPIQHRNTVVIIFVFFRDLDWAGH